MSVVTYPNKTGVPYGTVTLLSKSAIPYGIANTSVAGIQANGTFTLGTALNTTYSVAATGGIWLYFPAGAVSGDATGGFYYCIMTNTTAGTAYTSGAATTAVTGSGAGYTGDTSARTAVTVTIPGGAMGKNGSLRIHTAQSDNNSAGAKTTTVKLSSSVLSAVAVTTSVGGAMNLLTSNRNAYASQKTSLLTYSASTGALNYTTVDTSADQNLTITIQIATATDVIVLEDYMIELIPQM